MAIPVFLRTIEQTSFSFWLRESESLFPFWVVLTFHAVGMGILAGGNAVVSLRILGVARDLPLYPLERLYPVIWVGFWIQVASGLLLLTAFPTKSLTNPDFYLKLMLIGIAMVVMQKLRRRVFNDARVDDAISMMQGKTLAAWSLVLWVGVITAGRFLAYTYSHIRYPA